MENKDKWYQIMGKLLFDAVVFGFICFIFLLVAAFIVFPKPIKGYEFHMSGSLAIFVFLLSIAMMCLSGKYFKNPVSNTRSYTPWTWWKLKEKFRNNESKQLEKFYGKCI